MFSKFSRPLPVGVFLVGTLSYVSLALAAPPTPMPLSAQAATASLQTPLVLTPANGVWDLSSFDSVQACLKNPTNAPLTVWTRADNPTAKGVTDSVRSALILAPNETQTLRLRLMRRPQDPGYAAFKPFLMYFKSLNVRDNTVDASQIAHVQIYLDPSSPTNASVEVQSVSAEGVGSPANPPFLPFIDRYGQYIHTDWPDKIYSDADFAARRARENAEMKAFAGPSDWDKWGGWKSGPKQKATGFFYPAKLGDKWWLVDPDGALFWSYGPIGVGFGEGTPITGREQWFAELPDPNGPLARYYGIGANARYMYYQNKQYKTFDFSGANAQRNYGPDWKNATADAMHGRLRNWGFNTVANWSNPVVMMRRKTPYVVAIAYGGPTLDHIPDVFDPTFEKAVNDRMDKERGTTAGDPWNLGYYVDNELTWGSGARATSTAQGVLRAAPTSASKLQFVADLKAKYPDIAALNAAWKTDYASWEALLQSQDLPKTKEASYVTDCGDFGLKFAAKYFATVHDAVKRVAPNNLYLGCRFHGHIDGALVAVAAKYCDVISYNIYGDDPTGRLNQYRQIVDKPFIVGEFGITSDLGQMPWRGQIDTQEPTERLQPMENYLNHAFRYPSLVGAHFFQFRDQPLSGRGDGEATLRGFVNTADTPHFDLVQLNRRLAYNLYAIRAGTDHK